MEYLEVEISQKGVKVLMECCDKIIILYRPIYNIVICLKWSKVNLFVQDILSVLTLNEKISQRDDTTLAISVIVLAFR